MAFQATRSSTETPYFFAMTERDSPEATVCVVLVPGGYGVCGAYDQHGIDPRG